MYKHVRRLKTLFHGCLCLRTESSLDLQAARAISLSVSGEFLYDKMAAGQRVLVYLQDTEDDRVTKADFTQCVVKHYQGNQAGLTTSVAVELKDNRLTLAKPGRLAPAYKMKHPEFCPIVNLNEEVVGSLSEDVKSRGIDTGAAVILESGDGKILLTRRGDHLRTFPGIWVPPGGHIEENETLMEAGLRELSEETGLKINPDMCYQGNLPVLALWESVFPPKLAFGVPKRHHVVVYLYAKLKSDLTADVMMSKVKVDPGEVGACAWFDRDFIKAVVSVQEVKGKTEDSQLLRCLQDKKFRALVVNEKKDQVEDYLPLSPLLQPAGDTQDQRGRVSTGTKFALEEWLALPT